MISSKVRWVLSAILASALILIGSLPAAAVPPQHIRTTFSGAVTDQGQACGDSLSWEFTGELLVTRFFDADGKFIRVHFQVQESGTVTNPGDRRGCGAPSDGVPRARALC
jgi:hypothetical protein